ncbi:hypothetical protein [Streptomyces sp. NPDC060205]|uniref:hypothetical protein n=1 Tax=Streptomyces sp. NPDC060205 TaxID=3347072 RepID=UPI00365A89BC
MLRHSGGRPLDSLYSPHSPHSPDPDRPDPRRIRLAMLAVLVVLTVALPLAVASAGPVGRDAPASSSASSLSSARASAPSSLGDGRDGGERDAGGRGADSRNADGRDAGASGSGASGFGGSRSGGSASGSGPGGPAAGGHGSGEAPGSGRADGGAADRHPSASERSLTLGVGLATAARCGPELASPDGIEAQTCVLTQGRETWARTYYRNATGDALTSVLTLLAPGDRTVRMYCAVGADDEPGVCETPRQRTVGDASEYSAVAEFAGSAEGADAPLLLRSGSNSPVQNAR